MRHRWLPSLAQVQVEFGPAEVAPAEQGQCSMRWNRPDYLGIGVVVTKFFFLGRLLPLDDRGGRRPPSFSHRHVGDFAEKLQRFPKSAQPEYRVRLSVRF